MNYDKCVLTVKEIKEYLGIGINQAYELVNQNVFIVKRVGKKILIPKTSFEDWLSTK